MISVDPRVGSGDLKDLLTARGLPARHLHLDYGDVCFPGDGKDHHPVMIGVELKRVGDLLSCITDGRFSGHQLPGLLANYHRVYLIVEGLKRSDDGSLVTWQGQGRGWRPIPWGRKSWMWVAMDHWLISMEEKANVVVVHTSNRKETVEHIHSRYTWWAVDGWEAHKSHLDFDKVKFTGDTGINFGRQSHVRLIAKECPSIGWERSKYVEHHFGKDEKAVGRMWEATAQEWADIEIREVLKKGGTRIRRLGANGVAAYNWLRGR
jgi:hypothetical protein